MNELLAGFAFQGSPSIRTTDAILFLVVISSVLSGICTIIAGAKLRSTYQRGWLLIASGILRVIFVFPLGIFALMLVVAGLLEFVAAIQLRKYVRNTAVLALAGLTFLSLFPLLLIWPREISPLVLLGSLLIVFGGCSLAWGLTLRAAAPKAP